MTRESIPRIDLYSELEVSPLASVGVIEAAYRSLVKKHHPDVAAPADRERIKRLNVAYHWLADPARRRQYDGATAETASPATMTPRSATHSPAGPNSTSAVIERDPPPAQHESPPTTFGVNSAQVRQFLADLRALDSPRAFQVHEGKAAADAAGYAEARRVASIAIRSGRQGEWRLARDAAFVIARGQLGDSNLTSEISEVVGEIAGAIAIRDLLPRSDFELLLLPWTWRGGRVGDGPAAQANATRRPDRRAVRIEPRPAGAGPVHASRRAAPVPAIPVAALVGVIVVVAIWASVASLNGPQGAVATDIRDQRVLSATNFPAASLMPLAPGAVATVSPPIDPARLRELQLGASAAIDDLRTAAESGRVKAVQKLLGDTAPGLRASGLRRATFPDVVASQIAVVRSGDQWLGFVGTDRLESADGLHWTFDYADRPLAHYLRTSERDLYWLDSAGRRDLYVRVTSATISRSGVAVRFAWRFGSGDAEYFTSAELAVSSVVLGSNPTTADPLAISGRTRGTVMARISAEAEAPSSLLIHVTVTNGRAGTELQSIETDFELASG